MEKKNRRVRDAADLAGDHARDGEERVLEITPTGSAALLQIAENFFAACWRDQQGSDPFDDPGRLAAH
jgi:hypothetical protein